MMCTQQLTQNGAETRLKKQLQLVPASDSLEFVTINIIVSLSSTRIHNLDVSVMIARYSKTM